MRSVCDSMIVGAAAAVLAFAVAAAWQRDSGGAPAPQDAQPADDPALLRELAERLLGAGTRGAPGSMPEARLLVGTMPPDLPFDLPPAPGSRLIGSFVRPSLQRGTGQPSGESIEIVLNLPGEPLEILASYDGALPARGLHVAPVFGRQRPGGFLPSAGWVSSPLYCQSEAGPQLTVNVSGRPGAPSDVRLRIERGFPGPCAGPGSGTLSPPSAPVELPPLTPPAGAQVQPGGPGLREMDTIADTAMSAADLEAFYAGELEALGWRRRAGRTEGPLAWSLWDVPGEGSRQGYFSALKGPAPNQRFLHLQIGFIEGPGTVGPGLP